MGYGPDALRLLRNNVAKLAPGSGILEYGDQDIRPGISNDDILSLARVLHCDDEVGAQRAVRSYDGSESISVSELFRESRYRYRCLDLYPGEFTIVADLNLFTVPEAHRSSFDLITNFGTTEHVADQINAFRVMHDFARPGALMIHSVPFTGYFNHGLYNYNPVFFVFLAAANDYSIEGLGLSGQHLPYTIPAIEGLSGSGAWSDSVVESGILGCHLRKINDAPFKLFTDFDQIAMGRTALPSPWAEMIRDRYDLRVRKKA